MIHFKNQPKLSDSEVDQKFNDRRLSLVTDIEQFISSDERFHGKNVSIEFSQKGVSSLVSFIETEGQKFVLKIPLRVTAEGEGWFLREWEKIGVSVPHIFGEGKIGDRFYILMSFIEGSILTDAIKKGSVGSDISIEIGKVLSCLHLPRAQGYGRVIQGRAEYATFKDWILGQDVQKRIKIVQEHNLLIDAHGPISKVIDILIDFDEKFPGSTFCHFDFGANNILATEPLTVIDPDPMINKGVIDIGRSVQLASSGGFYKEAEQLKEGYFSNNSLYDKRVLQASIILSAYWKFPYWHKKNNREGIENTCRYLSQTSHFL